jgi:hypothetical protein
MALMRPVWSVLLAVLVLAVTASPSAARGCDVSRDGRKLGPTYVTSLSVARVSCAEGKAVVRAYDRCRRRHGGVKGRCPSRVRRFRCAEGRRTAIQIEFNVKVGCRRGGRRVRFAYEQYT